MALIQMKCANCGAALRQEGGQYVCDYCGAISLFFADADADISQAVTAEEFRQKLAQSGRTYLIEPGGNGISDVDEKILQGKLKAAQKALSEGKGYLVEEYLKGIPANVFAAERLRLLSEAGVKDEAELSAYAGELSSFGHYDSALAAAGERTRETYREIEKVCRKNAEISREIGKGRDLLQAGMLADGLAYAEEMVRRYPAHARARELLIEAKCLSDENYSPFADLEFFKACPDASVAVSGGEEDYYGAPKNISPVIAERCKQVAGRRMSRDKLIGKYLIRPLLVLIAVGALVGVWFLIDSLFGR